MKKIRELRKQRKLTMKELGEKINVAESTVSLYENGKRQPDFETIKKLADFFGVTTDYLLERTDTPTPVPQTAQSAETEIQAEFNKLTESEQKDVLDYIRFKKCRRPEAKGLKELDAEIMEQNISRAAFTPSVPDFTDESEEFMNKKNSPSKD